jgi:hypothetical protein
MSMALVVKFQDHLNALRRKKFKLTKIEDYSPARGEAAVHVFPEVVDVGGVEFPGDRDHRSAGVQLSSESRPGGGETAAPTFGRPIYVVNNSH